MQAHRSFLEDVIDEGLPLEPLAPPILDDLLQCGWRLLGYAVIRHNFAVNQDRLCRTIPLRIRLDVPLRLSKSQRQLLRRNADLDVRVAPIQITRQKEQLFLRHAQRFKDRQPTSIYSFLHLDAHERPVTGVEFSVFEHGQLIACSFIHLGAQAVSGTYCFFDPDFQHRRLGVFTLLLELQFAQQLGKQFYYHGYSYDVPSEFDYKLNFNNLEAMDWKSGIWHPQERVAPRS